MEQILNIGYGSGDVGPVTGETMSEGSIGGRSRGNVGCWRGEGGRSRGDVGCWRGEGGRSRGDVGCWRDEGGRRCRVLAW